MLSFFSASVVEDEVLGVLLPEVLPPDVAPEVPPEALPEDELSPVPPLDVLPGAEDDPLGEPVAPPALVPPEVVPEALPEALPPLEGWSVEELLDDGDEVDGVALLELLGLGELDVEEPALLEEPGDELGVDEELLFALPEGGVDGEVVVDDEDAPVALRSGPLSQP